MVASGGGGAESWPSAAGRAAVALARAAMSPRAAEVRIAKWETRLCCRSELLAAIAIAASSRK